MVKWFQYTAVITKFSFTKRVHYLVTALVMSLIILHITVYQYKVFDYKMAEREKELSIITGILCSRSISFHQILLQRGALNNSVQEQVLILNSILQPIVDELHQLYPRYGMGYYSLELDHNIAIQPFSLEKLIPPPINSQFFEIYETGKPKVSHIKNSIAWNGAPAISYAVPLYYDKEIIGHTWANINTNDLKYELYLNILKISLIGLLILIIVNLILKKTFETLSQNISTFANSFAQNESVNIELMPELQPIITQAKRNMDEINKLDRLNLIGQMAAGIGHEVRNPMTTVRGFLQLLKGKEECSKYGDYFVLMIEELDRANSIITDFLELAKTKPGLLEKKNLNEIIKAVSPLLEAQALEHNKNIEISLQEIPDVIVNENEVRQIILNLVKNGLDASPTGPNLKISTYFEQDEVVLAVQDFGSGIKSEIADKIGTPFFTTKAEGTGLGLATCYTIAARNDAKINFVSGQRGTTFFVRFINIAKY